MLEVASEVKEREGSVTPEGPELLRSRDQLRQLLWGKRLTTMGCGAAGRYSGVGQQPKGFHEFQGDWQKKPMTVSGIDVKGKFMYWTLSPAVMLPVRPEQNWYLWCTYGMSGQWSTQVTEHTAFSVGVTGSSGFVALHFNDPRRFGTLKFVKGQEALDKKLASLGPDMLSDPPDFEGFLLRLLAREDKTIAQALMDQSCVSGVGNYVKCESLYLAEISPHRLVSDLYMSEVKRLREQIVNVMRASYASGGATIRTYQNVDGDKGGAQSRFVVYGNKVDPLGNQVIKEETADGRTTHWVPQLQK